MTQTFGEFRENLPTDQEFLILGFSPSSIPLKQRWRNNGLSADFIADYLTTFFPVSEDEPNTKEKQAEFKGSVNYIANELLENAMKFSDDTCTYPIKLGLHLIKDTRVTVVLIVTNSIPAAALDKFQTLIQELLDEDPAELYIRQLEKNACNDKSNSSGLGLITMRHDYLAKLGWKFETVQKEPQVVAVTTMVQLTL
ncbi:MAG TPA: ATP-binding protein [Cyanobacteria bacterium UBA11371]|nr:ATP-binding protein [Cyanobacteria bacterium UBA11371]HBE29824.1 ATP-binding protein [Cyanobacteria bacterium UBA11368]